MRTEVGCNSAYYGARAGSYAATPVAPSGVQQNGFGVPVDALAALVQPVIVRIPLAKGLGRFS